MKTFFLIISIFASSLLFGQNSSDIETSYTEYFKLPRESLYLHLNKTTYIKGEEIWFKCYAYDRRNSEIFQNTSNIQIGVYNSDGQQLDKKLFLAENGSTYGNILIDSTFIAGDYFVKASTNWMRNFQEDDSFIQKIKIIDSDYSEMETITNTYDIQILPEGGHAILNAKNSYGIKVIDNNGLSVPYSGKVYGDGIDELTTFASNHLGLGKFSIRQKSDVTYSVEIALKNGSLITKELPRAELNGIIINIDNSHEKHIVLAIHTNPNTLTSIKNKDFKIAIHKDGMMKILPFSFNKSTRHSLEIDRVALFDGINTITLFNSNNEPINERLLYNFSPYEAPKLYISQMRKTSDSISFSIYQPATKTLNLSISVLPSATVSYSPEHNIISAFHLKPYIHGYIENPLYYFQKIDKKKEADLDLLLLTQGWSRYDWKDIFSRSPKSNYTFEQGVRLKGIVNSNYSNIDSLYLYPSKYYQAQFIPLDADKKFVVNHFYVLENEILKFSSVNKNGQFLKPNLYISYEASSIQDSIHPNVLNNYKQNMIISNPPQYNNFVNDTIKLNEVNISVPKVPKDKIESFNLSFKNKTTVVTESVGLTYPSVIDYIRSNGYNVGLFFGKVLIKSRIPLSLGGGDGNREVYPSPSIYLDDVLLQDFNILYELPTANIKKIFVDKAGLGQGLNEGAAGVIRIYMKQNSVFDIKEASKSTNTYFPSEPSIAFAVTKTYYTPKYKSFSEESFKEYGAISWFPKIDLSQNVSEILKIPNTDNESIIFFIEGMTDDGILFSEQRTFKIN